MTSKLLILILGISNLCAEKHIKGEPYDSILESDHKRQPNIVNRQLELFR